MIMLEQIRTTDHEIGLTKLIGKQIKEIHGYLSNAMGGFPCFKITKVEFKDGTYLGCEGEHDFPYLVEYDKQPNFDDVTFCRFCDEEDWG